MMLEFASIVYFFVNWAYFMAVLTTITLFLDFLVFNC